MDEKEKESEIRFKKIKEAIIDVISRLRVINGFDETDITVFFIRGFIITTRASLVSCDFDKNMIDITRDNLCFIDKQIEDFIAENKK